MLTVTLEDNQLANDVMDDILDMLPTDILRQCARNIAIMKPRECPKILASEIVDYIDAALTDD